MINFETKYFRKLHFIEKQVEQLSKSASHDLKIAEGSDIPDKEYGWPPYQNTGKNERDT